MKSQLSEKFYFQYWDAMMERYGENPRFYANLEKQLSQAMAMYKNLPGIAIEAVKQIEAENIAKRCKEKMLKTMAMIKRIENGEGSLGYTNVAQEISARKELREGFEFTCLVLREFKKEHNIEC